MIKAVLLGFLEQVKKNWLVILKVNVIYLLIMGSAFALFIILASEVLQLYRDVEITGTFFLIVALPFVILWNRRVPGLLFFYLPFYAILFFLIGHDFNSDLLTMLFNPAIPFLFAVVVGGLFWIFAVRFYLFPAGLHSHGKLAKTFKIAIRSALDNLLFTAMVMLGEMLLTVFIIPGCESVRRWRLLAFAATEQRREYLLANPDCNRNKVPMRPLEIPDLTPNKKRNPRTGESEKNG